MPGPMPAPRKALFAMLLLLALTLRGLSLVQPWDGLDWHSALGGFGTGAYAKNFAAHGFAEARWMPYRWRVDLADGSDVRFWYTHHPALYSVLTGFSVALFGARTWAVHVPSLVASILSLFACRRLGRALGSEREALLATAFFALLPMGVYYGVLPWAEVPIAWLFLEICAAYVVWWRTRARRALWVLLGCVLLGGLLDWPAHFLLPGLSLHVLLSSLRAREPRRALVVCWMAVAAILPIGLHWLHLQWVVPDSRHSDTENTLEWVTTLAVPLGDFVGFQWRVWLRTFTEPVAALCGVGLLAQLGGVLRGERAFENGLLLVLLVPPLAYVGLFPGRSVNHEFFWYLALPWVALTAAGVCEAVLARLRSRPARVGAWAAIVLLLGLGAWRGAVTWLAKDTTAFDSLTREPWLREILDDPRNVVVTGAGDGQLLHFFSDASLVCDIKTVEALEELRRDVLSRVDRERPVFYLFGLRFRQFFLPLQEFLREHGTLVLTDEASPIGFELYDLSAWSHRAR